VILEAFSGQLQDQFGRGRSPEQILHDWLLEILTQPANAQDQIGRVIHTEIELFQHNEETCFRGVSPSGRRLLESLYGYCRSYENWQFAKWLHHLRASDFPPVIT
jgi:hypothetical protein